MRTKDEILSEYNYTVCYPTNNNSSMLNAINQNQRLLLEVLLDIRNAVNKVPGSV